MFTALGRQLAARTARQCVRFSAVAKPRISSSKECFTLRCYAYSSTANGSSSNNTNKSPFEGEHVQTMGSDNDSDFSHQSYPPTELTPDMIEGLSQVCLYYIQCGAPHRRLLEIATQNNNNDVVEQWQSMMQVFVTTQAHCLAGLGYAANDAGLGQFSQDVSHCLQRLPPEKQEELQESRRITWRLLVATAFGINPDDLPVITLMDARKYMHMLSTEMIKPHIIATIQQEIANVDFDGIDTDTEAIMKHQILQQVVVNHVYLGGSPSIVEKVGMGSGGVGYAKLQCAISDHEGDPLLAQYAAAAMREMWKAAGMDADIEHVKRVS